MDREELKFILAEIGISGDRYGRYPNSGDNVQFCCPFHGETRPSCGIHTDSLVGKCFACGETFNLAKLVAHGLEFYYPNGDLDISRGYRWLEEKYNLDMRVVNDTHNLRRIDDNEYEEVGRHEIPLFKIAPFKSGKATHNYFFNRGFTKETVKKFMIGWDSVLKRVTMPIFWRDGTLFGVIGRAILNPKLPNGDINSKYTKVYNNNNYARYYIYDKAPIGDILYPLNLFELKDDTAILVEGQMDCIWLHQLGFTNALSSITSKLAVNKKTGKCKQLDILRELGVKKVILMRDNDKAGEEGVKHDYKVLKKDFTLYTVEYPKGKTDPQQLTKKEVEQMLRNKKMYLGNTTKLRRIL